MQKRILTAIPALLLLAAVIYVHGIFMMAVFSIVALISEFEIINAANKSGIKTFRILLYVFTALLPVSFYFYGFTGFISHFTVFVISVCIAAITRKELALKSMAYTLAFYIYPQVFYLFLYATARVSNTEQSRLMLIMAFTCAILTDTFAFFTGRLFGKRKLSPLISPNKTVAGAVGGIIGGMLAVIVIGLFIQDYFSFSISLLHYFILGFIMSVASQTGDITASLLKREFKIKDYGDILPGHGGIMDRLDSVLFITPVLYFYFTIIV